MDEQARRQYYANITLKAAREALANPIDQHRNREALYAIDRVLEGKTPWDSEGDGETGVIYEHTEALQ